MQPRTKQTRQAPHGGSEIQPPTGREHGLDWNGLEWNRLSTWTYFLRSWTGSVDSPSTWTVQFNLTQTKARRKKFGSEKRLHQKMRRLKAQLMGTFSGKSQTPLDSPFLPDSATFSFIMSLIMTLLVFQCGEEDGAAVGGPMRRPRHSIRRCGRRQCEDDSGQRDSSMPSSGGGMPSG